MDSALIPKGVKRCPIWQFGLWIAANGAVLAWGRNIAYVGAGFIGLALGAHLAVIGGVTIAAVILAVLAAPSVQRWASATVSVPYERVRTATVERGDLVRDVTVQGRVVAAETIFVAKPQLVPQEAGGENTLQES